VRSRPDTETILSRPPFSGRLTIDGIAPLQGGESGRTFRISEGTRQYKLHRAASRLAAIRIEKRARRFARLLPTLIGRDGRYLLFEWVDGHKPDIPCDPRTAFLVGQFCGEVHAAGIGCRMDPDRYFAKRLARIPDELLGTADKERIRLTYTRLRAGLGLECVVGISDLHPHNFIEDGRGGLYLVDEGAISPEIKGRAFIKAFSEWIAPDARDAFWDGYTTRHANGYFTAQYETVLSLVEAIRAIDYRARQGLPPSRLQREREIVASLCDLEAR